MGTNGAATKARAKGGPKAQASVTTGQPSIIKSDDKRQSKKRDGEISLSREAARVLEKYLGQTHGRVLRTIIYESKRKTTVRLVLLPANKLVVVQRETESCRTLLQLARKTLQRKGLNQAFVYVGQTKTRLYNTAELEDDSRVAFEIGEYVEEEEDEEISAAAVVEDDEAESTLEEEDEDAQDNEAVEEEDCFDRLKAAADSLHHAAPASSLLLLPSIDFDACRLSRIKLPIDEFEAELAHAVAHNTVTILSAPTGSGKSTRLPQFILEHASRGALASCNMVVTEPRRIAAITLADRVSDELGDAVGGVCGYSVRTASNVGPSTRILFCTVGVLLKRLAHDAELRGVTHVLVDEAHEQDVLTDLLLVFLRDLLRTRPLRVCILSATMRSQTFADYFAEFPCKQLSVPGRMYDVDALYLEDLEAIVGRQGGKSSLSSEEPHRIAACIDHYLRRHPDRELDYTILVFVCGRKEILQTMARLRALVLPPGAAELDILPLHSQLSNEDQRRVFHVNTSSSTSSRGRRRRVVISTNVAETSVTIPNVGLVLDCGLFKEATYDADRRVQELRPTRVSTSAMMQRRGRAGRTAPGTCYHLFSRLELLDDTAVPGMQKDSLESAMLFLKAAKHASNAYAFFAEAPNPPPLAHVTATLQDLVQLGVLQGKFSCGGSGVQEDVLVDETRLTALGFHLAKLGTTCRVGKLLVFGCLLGCVDDVLTIAATLDGKSPFHAFALKPAKLHEIRTLFGEDDFSAYLRAREVYFGSSEDRGDAQKMRSLLSPSAMELNEKIREDFARDLVAAGFLLPRGGGRGASTPATDKSVLGICLAAGLFPHMGKVTQNGIVFSTGQYELERSFFDPNATLTRVDKNAFFVYHNRVRLGASSLSLQRICVVNPLAMVLFAGGLQRSRSQNAKMRVVTFKLGRCWSLQCRNRDANMLLELRKLLSEALLEIYELPSGGGGGATTTSPVAHQELFRVIKTLF